MKALKNKQEFLCSLYSEDNVCRSITQNKTVSDKYLLELANKRERVCQTCFLETLNISHKSVTGALQRKRNGRLSTRKDQRIHSAHNKTPKKIQCISDYIISFPTLDLHYTRKATNCKFLEQHINIRQMRSRYIKSHQHTLVKKSTRNFLTYVPKKDQCLSCTQFAQKTNSMSSQTGDELILKYNEHQHIKKASYKHFMCSHVRNSLKNRCNAKND